MVTCACCNHSVGGENVWIYAETDHQDVEELKAEKGLVVQITAKRKAETISKKQPDVPYQEILSFPEKLEILLFKTGNYKMYVWIELDTLPVGTSQELTDRTQMAKKYSPDWPTRNRKCVRLQSIVFWKNYSSSLDGGILHWHLLRRSGQAGSTHAISDDHRWPVCSIDPSSWKRN